MLDIDIAHADGRHASTHPEDRRFWIAAGCSTCTAESGNLRTVPVAFRCLECHRVWTVKDDPDEWAYGHDCEV